MKRKRFYGWWLMLLCASLLSVAVWGAFPALGMAAGAAEETDSKETDSKETDSKGMDLKEMDSKRSNFKEAVSEEAELKEAELEVAGVESPVVVTDVYTDSHGVTYRWRGYGDGTAEIYEFSFGEGDVVMEIPGSLDGYIVTRLTGAVGKREIVSVTIPESITAFGQGTFRESAIGTVYYNAVDAVALDSLYFSPFGYTEIGDFVVGDRVEKFAGYLFYETVFL